MGSSEHLAAWLDGLSEEDEAVLCRELYLKARVWRWRWAFRTGLGLTFVVLWLTPFAEWYLTGRIPSECDWFASGAISGLAAGALLGLVSRIDLECLAARHPWPKSLAKADKETVRQ